MHLSLRAILPDLKPQFIMLSYIGINDYQICHILCHSRILCKRTPTCWDRSGQGVAHHWNHKVRIFDLLLPLHFELSQCISKTLTFQFLLELISWAMGCVFFVVVLRSFQTPAAKVPIKLPKVES